MKTPASAKILIVDDDEDALYSFRRVFDKSDYHIEEAHTGEEALKLAERHQPDVILMDIRMPGMGGLEALKELRKIDARTPVILMTAYSSPQGTIEAIKSGAFEYVVKPIEVDRIRTVVREAIRTSRDMREPVVLADEQPVGNADDTRIVGQSDAMVQVFKHVGRLASTQLPVLVRGESGTGKDLLARAIYQHSRRALKSYTVVTCGADSQEAEREIFGYVRGAFPGAADDRPGKLEVGAGGTIYIDQIHRLSTQGQQKLARFLRTGELERVGSNRIVKVDIRLLASTVARHEADKFPVLTELLLEFRDGEIELPPLRERRADIPALVEHFLLRLSDELGKPGLSVASSAMDALQRQSWPQNVRELERVLARSATKADNSVLSERDLQLASTDSDTTLSAAVGAVADIAGASVFDLLFEELRRRQPLPEGLDAFDVVEQQLVERALQACAGNQSRTARFLGITRNTLRKRIAKYGLKVDRLGDAEDSAGSDEV